MKSQIRLQTTQAVILAGGLGTRLRPITESVPKPLVEVHGRPFIVWLLEYLRTQNIKDVVLLLGYLGEKLEHYLLQNPVAGLNISYSHESSPMGTAGALFNAKALLNDKFWLVNGDTFIKLDFSQVENFALKHKLLNTIVSYDNPESIQGSPNLKIKNHIVDAYKKNSSKAEGFNCVDAGVYLLDKSLLANHELKVMALEDLWQNEISLRRLGSYVTNIPFYDMGTLEKLKNAPQLF